MWRLAWDSRIRWEGGEGLNMGKAMQSVLFKADIKRKEVDLFIFALMCLFKEEVDSIYFCLRMVVSF